MNIIKRNTYSGLFEDEIAEILRSLPLGRTVISDALHTWYPAAGVYEDGIVTSGSGLFSEYFLGKRTGNHIGCTGLIRCLAHEEFTVTVKEA